MQHLMFCFFLLVEVGQRGGLGITLSVIIIFTIVITVFSSSAASIRVPMCQAMGRGEVLLSPKENLAQLPGSGE